MSEAGLGRRALAVAVALACVLGLAPAVASAATISSSTANPLLDNFVDDAICSLREMVQIANTNSGAVEGECTVTGTPGDDTINLGAGTYQVNTAGGEDATPDDNVQGDLDIGGMGNLAITGAGQATTLINEAGGMPGTRVMEVTAGDLDLTDLTVTGGTSVAPTDAINGGGILFGSAGTLELLRTSFTSSATGGGGDGGAINNGGGTTIVRDSDIVSNAASDVGGGIRGFHVTVSEGSLIQNNTGSGGGGGVRSLGNFSLTDSVIDNNHTTAASAVGGGLSLTATGATSMTIARSRIINNDTANDGGGIHATPGTGNTLAIDDTLIQDNQAISGTGSVEGGGIHVLDGTTTINRSVVRSNEAMHTGMSSGASAGGIRAGNAVSASTLRLTDSAVADNTASSTDDDSQVSGGGIRDVDGTLELRRTTVSGNTLSGPTLGGNQFGGGIELGPNQGSLLLLNSTVSGNTAPKLPAVGAGRGGGIWASDSVSGGPTTLQVILSTIAGNTAGDVGGGADPGDAIRLEGGAATVRSSVIQSADGDEACDPLLTSGGRNVTNDSACFALAMAGDAQGTDPLLGALADNSGPLIGAPGALERLQTRALLAGSPALDRVPVAECTNEVPAAAGTDERGVTRPQGPACDSGAFEVSVPVPLTASPGSCAGKTATITGTDSAETITGTPGADVIAAQGGKDIVNALGGNDVVCGGDGNDRLSGGGGKDVLRGEGGKDKLIGGGAKDTCVGGPAKDKPPPLSCEKQRSI